MREKKIKGRKCQITTDKIGLVWGLIVHSAGIQDRVGAYSFIDSIFSNSELSTVKTIYADGAYSGKLVKYVKEKYGVTLEIVKKLGGGGFQVLPNRWQVERTLAWLTFGRRLVKDYEKRRRNSLAMLSIRSIKISVQKYIKANLRQ